MSKTIIVKEKSKLLTAHYGRCVCGPALCCVLCEFAWCLMRARVYVRCTLRTTWHVVVAYCGCVLWGCVLWGCVLQCALRVRTCAAICTHNCDARFTNTSYFFTNQQKGPQFSIPSRWVQVKPLSFLNLGWTLRSGWMSSTQLLLTTALTLILSCMSMNAGVCGIVPIIIITILVKSIFS
jgi:hypothetical protein